jgi:Flp pilus assembly protein TadD/energy-coupling factor transporter ATP-binding protein EcfA2
MSIAVSNFYLSCCVIIGAAIMSEAMFAGLGGGWGGGQGIAATVKYNPHLWSADELRAIFVLRQHELATILAAIRAVPAGSVAQHMLITGQRGMGKSTLLQRVALAVAEDAEASQSWLALRFPEEQYTVSTPAELWRNVIGALADTLERQGLPIEAIDLELLKLGEMPMAQREEAALDWLNQWCDKQQKRLVLLMDNTDLLFSNLAGAAANKRAGGPDGGASALWRVRKVLLHSPHFFWLGGSYQPLEVSGLYSDAFLDFFQLIELRPLTLLEMQTAILALARTFGAGLGLRGEAAENEVRRMLEARPERLRAMRQLTGGNPRTTISLYELFAVAGQESVRSDLERLLDALTPLYKARLDILADQMRKVLAHVMECWAPVTAKALSDVSGIAVGMVSTQLVRLEQEGLVEKVSLSGKKRQGYQVAERFFNIWYLMRNAPRSARARVGWLVEFMRLWYSKDEMQGIAKSRWLAHRDGGHCDFAELEYSRALARAMPKSAQERQYLDWAVFRQARKSAALSDLFDLEGEDADYSTPDDYLARLDKVRIGLMAVQLEEPEKASWVHEVMSAIDLTLSEKEELAKSCAGMAAAPLASLRIGLQQNREFFIELFELPNLNQLEMAVENGDFFPDCPDAKLALTQIETCFGESPNQFVAAVGLLLRQQSDPIVGLACKKAIELAPNSAQPWCDLGVWLYQHTTRYDEAEAAYRKAIELVGNWAMPWATLGDLLQYKLNRYDEAEAAYRKAIELDGNWAPPWADLGNLFQYKLNRFDEAEAAYRKVIELDGNWAEPWGDLGVLLQYKLNRFDEAEVAYRKVIELDGNWARPWGDLGVLLQDKLIRYDEAEVAYRKAIELDGNWAQPWGALGDLLHHELHRYDEAEAAYRKAIELEASWVEPWVDLGNLLQYNLNRYDEAETAYRKAIELDPKQIHPIEQLVYLLHRNSTRFEECVDFLKTALNLKHDSTDLWNTLGELLQNKLKRFDEAEEVYRNGIKCGVADAFLHVNLGRLLVVLKRNDEATEQYRLAMEVADATAHNLRLQAHCWLGNSDLALQALDALAEQASKGEESGFFNLKEQCQEIHAIGLGNVLSELMARSTYAGFLQPFALALRVASGEKEVLQDVPAEVRSLAEEMVLQITDLPCGGE